MPHPVPLHVAFVTEFDVNDPMSYSGIPKHMLAALRRQVERVSVVAPLPRRKGLGARARKLRARLQGRDLLLHHTEHVAQGFARAAEPVLRRLRPDVVLSPGTLAVAYLDAPCPVVPWPDATFESNLYFYGAYSNLSNEGVLEGHRVERAALENAALALFATEDAAGSATGFYGTPEAKVKLARYGANLEPPPERAFVEAHLDARPTDRCQLLFAGGDWVRKGGDVAVRVAEELGARGVPAELVVAGTHPPLDRPLPFVREAGFFDKSDPAQRASFFRLFAESHFLCMPVRAEDFGCVFAEAAAFGVPSLTTAIGGMPTTVGEAGLLFPFHARPQEIAEAAAALLAAPEAYRALARRARDRFEALLNWDTATRHVIEFLAAL